jgi:ABC-2 type transport system ATP-binding protein
VIVVALFKGGAPLLILVVLIALAYGVVRLRRRGHARRSSAGSGAPPSAAKPLPTESPEVVSRALGTSAPAAAVNLEEAYRPARAVAQSSGLSEGWAVETHGLTKRFGTNVAVNDVELLVPRGVAFGYLGPNGAGKTTLIRTLLGLTHADGGTMSVLGIPLPSQRERALARVGAIVDEPRFHPHLTGRENLRLLAAARGGQAQARIAASLARVGLAERVDQKVASYSMGMRQRLGVASALLGDPQLLILDEPMNGLDPAGMQEMRTLIASFVSEGRTVVLSSHLLDEVQRTCDAVAIVDHGRIIRQGPIAELLEQAGGLVMRVDCSEPTRAAHLIAAGGIAATTAAGEEAITVTLAAGASRETVAEMNRRLVASGIAVYGLRQVQTTLEDWFLSVTSRLGEQA